VAHADQWDWPSSARRTRSERLHVTLHFLGDVAASRLAELQEGLHVPWGGCELQLDHGQVWPGWLAVLEALKVPPALAELHGALAERLGQLGLPVEQRRYRPHVTLARKAFGARPPPGFRSLPWRATGSYLLVQSLPGGRGYEPLQCLG
jgi:2'-5' RNA ligase